MRRIRGPMARSLLLIVITGFILGILAGCGTQKVKPQTVVPPGQRLFVDMAGREVLLPETLHKVYPVSPVETVLLYTLAPDLLAGWSYHMGADESPYILPEYRQLPVLGWVSRGSTANVEEILRLKPDAILMMADMTDKNKDYAEQLQKLTHIPVIFLEQEAKHYSDIYRAAGQAFSRPERADKLAAYADETWRELEAGRKKLEGRKPVRVYYAEGRRGLETEPRGSWHAQVIDWVGGENVADPDLPKGSQIGRSPVSLEQVMAWNPEVILISYFRDGEQSSFPEIMEDAGWRDIRAVQRKQVYEIPTGPFNWMDRPPSVARLLGARWVGNLLYPDVYDFDFSAEIKRFYALFYQYELSDRQVQELANRAQRQ